MFSDNPKAVGIYTDRLDEIRSSYNEFMTKYPDFRFHHETMTYRDFFESLPEYLCGGTMYNICTLYTKMNFDYVNGKYIYKTSDSLMDLMMSLMKTDILSETQWHTLLNQVECFDFNDEYEMYTERLLKILNRYYYEAHVKLSDIMFYIRDEFTENGVFSEKFLYCSDFDFMSLYRYRTDTTPVIASCCKAVYDETSSLVSRWPKAVRTLHFMTPGFLNEFILEKEEEQKSKERSKRKRHV